MATKKKKARDPHPEEGQRELVRRLESGLPRVVVLRGEEAYFREHGVRRVIEAARKAGQEICRHDAKDPEFVLARVLDDLVGGALFADARCVVVRNADPLLKKGSRGFAQSFVDSVLSRIASDEPGSIVLAAESLRADHAVMKALTKVDGIAVGCRRLWDTPPPWNPDPRRTELVEWLGTRARARKIPLSPEEAVYVAASTGNDLSALESQLDRLEKRAGQGLAEVVGWDSGGSPFELAEHLLRGDAARSVAGIEALFKSGFHGRDGSRTLDRGGLLAILCSSLTARVRESIVGAEALERGEDVRTAAQKAGVRGGPNAVRSFEERIRGRRSSEWRRFLDDAAELERRSRSGATVDANDLAVLALRWAGRRR